MKLDREAEIEDEIDETLVVQDRFESAVSFIAFLCILAILTYIQMKATA